MREIKREIVGGLFFSKDNKALLGKNRNGGTYEGLLTIPGGGVENNETLLEALRREMKEETGIDIHNSKVTLAYETSGTSEKTLADTGERVLMKMNFHNFRIDLDKNANEVSLNCLTDWHEPQWIETDKLQTLNLPMPLQDTLISIGLLKP